MPTMLDLEPAARHVVELLDGVRDDQLDDPTPCEEMTVRDLLSHFLGLSIAFGAAAMKAPQPAGARPGGTAPLSADWREQLPQALAALVAAWREPAAWEGEAGAGGVTMPAEMAGLAAIDELVLHGWDLARATGQPFEPDAASVEACHRFTSMTAAPGAPREGLFGPVVPVPDGAPLFDQALGMAGRDPAWKP